MKRLIPMLLLILAAVCMPVTVQAVETESPASHVTITVVMPDPSADPEDAAFPSLPLLPELDRIPAQESEPADTVLYPSNVQEILENGVRWIIKTYELGAEESPAGIPRDSFERSAGTSGWSYSLTDITKKETAAADVRDRLEVVTINTETKDMETILRQLAPTMEFTTEDGYIGILALDVASITVETAGTKTSSYTASATREYPHLSSNDTSLVPKTITDGGRTLTLASVDWKTNHSMTVDYEQVPASYTAIAVYTASASRTVVTGYTTTAEYKGSVSRLNQGLTVYTAYFMGTEIVPERTPLEIIDSETESTDASVPEDEPGTEPESVEATDTETGTETDKADTENVGVEVDRQKPNPLLIFIPAAVIILLLGLGAGSYIPHIIKNKKEKGE